MWIPMNRRPSYLMNNRNKRRKGGNAPVGPYYLLSEPVTTKLDCENVIINGLEIGHASMQGYRFSMEDKHIIGSFKSLSDHCLVAIMDGHAGIRTAEFTSENLLNFIEQTEQWIKYTKLDETARTEKISLISEALVQAYRNIDTALLELTDMDESGCTAVCAVVTPTRIVCASVGDSRCVIGTNGSTISLTEDHKPSNPEEKLRIEKAGGFVVMDRVNGELAMSRALGDFRYKNDPVLSDNELMVISYPDIAIHERNAAKDEIMILACDGVWDVMTNSEAVAYIADIVLAEESLKSLTNNENNINSNNNNSSSLIITGNSIVIKKKDNNKDNNVDNKNNNKNNYGKRNKEDDSGIDVTAQEAAESLIDLCLEDGSTDNISAIVLRFIKDL